MQVTDLKNEELAFEAKISISSNIIDNEVKKELLDLTGKVKLAGFRTGKVPLTVINQRYGKSARQEVLQHQISHAVNHLIKEHKLEIVGDPKIDNLQSDEGKDLSFLLKLELMPKVSLPDFKKITLDKPHLLVADKDIDRQLEKLAELSKSYDKESKAKIKKGDQVTLDAIGYVNDKAFEGGKLVDHKLVIGSGAFIEGFEDQLIGAKAGSEVEVNVTFPLEYHAKELEGQPAKFVVQIKAVHVSENAKIDEEFAKKFKANSLEELRDNMAKHLKMEFDEPINIIMKMKFFNQLENLLHFNVPKSLLDQENKLLDEETKKNDKDDSIFKGKSKEEVSDYYNKLALRRVRIGLMLAEYVKVKKLQIENADIQNAVMLQAKNFPGQEHLLFDFYNNNPKALESLKGPILEEKAVKHIFDNEVTLVQKDYNQEQLKKFLETEEENAIVM